MRGLEQLGNEVSVHTSDLDVKTREAKALVDAAKETVVPEGVESASLKHFRNKLRHYEQVLAGQAGKEKAAELCDRLAEGMHPLNAFLRLSQAELGCSEALELFQLVAREYGNLLAVAAVTKNVAFSRQGPAAVSRRTRERGTTRRENLREKLPGLTCRLISENRLGPAYWLTCYHEQKFGAAPVPSLLLKALELADVIEGERGPASQWLTHIYRQPGFDSLFTESQEITESRLAVQLLTVAALMRPALLAPETGASLLLGKLGDLPPGLAACTTLISLDMSQPVGVEELDILSREAVGWRQRNRRLTMAAALATRLWDAILEEGGLLEKILRPVIDNDLGAVEEVRELVDHLRDESLLKTEIGSMYRNLQEMDAQLHIFHVLGSWQIVARLREALELAERWLTVHRRLNEAGGKTSPLPKAKLLVLMQSARDDVNDLAGRYPHSDLVKAATAWCGHALCSLEELLRRGQTEVEKPEDLSTVEYGKCPQLKLKPLWQPNAEAVERLGEALVGLLDDAGADVNCTGQKDPFAERASESAEFERLWEDVLLSTQEKEFIRDTFFDKLGKDDFCACTD